MGASLKYNFIMRKGLILLLVLLIVWLVIKFVIGGLEDDWICVKG